MKRIDLAASEEKSFENVDDGRTTDDRTDASIYYKLTYEPSAQVSLKIGCYALLSIFIVFSNKFDKFINI